MPNQVKTVRVLMFVVAGLTLAMALAFFKAEGDTAGAIGAALWFALPGVLSLLLALRVPNGGTGLRRAIIALEVLFIPLSLSRVGQGDPRGALNLALPIVILVLMFRPEAKAYFSGEAADDS